LNDDSVTAPPSAGVDNPALTVSVEVETVAPALLCACGTPMVRPFKVTVVVCAAAMAVVSCTVNELSPTALGVPAIPPPIVGAAPAVKYLNG